jgi:hypothetical protein
MTSEAFRLLVYAGFAQPTPQRHKYAMMATALKPPVVPRAAPHLSLAVFESLGRHMYGTRLELVQQQSEYNTEWRLTSRVVADVSDNRRSRFEGCHVHVRGPVGHFERQRLALPFQVMLFYQLGAAQQLRVGLYSSRLASFRATDQARVCFVATWLGQQLLRCVTRGFHKLSDCWHRSHHINPLAHACESCLWCHKVASTYGEYLLHVSTFATTRVALPTGVEPG